MLLQRMLKIMKNDESTNEDSSLKSTSKLYCDVELAVKVMLYSVGTITSECGIESLISSIGYSNSKGRPISLEQVHSELMIKKNGPHPLDRNITKFLHESLLRHFGGGPATWTFTHGSHKWCPTKSVVVSRLQRDTPAS